MRLGKVKPRRAIGNITLCQRRLQRERRYGMRLKVVSDGHPRNTKVINEDTGEAVEGVSSLEWKIDRNNLATVTMRVESGEAEIVGLLEKKQKIGAGNLTGAVKEFLGKMTAEQRNEVYRFLHDVHNCREF
ncbi:MAG: hypothetical protein ACE5I0_00855 [Candidatus Binatia bacterium]